MKEGTVCWTPSCCWCRGGKVGNTEWGTADGVFTDRQKHELRFEYEGILGNEGNAPL